ncbi:DedA family protein [uncultured Jatrophihabitans sp.]|uniref:DedA family protein n=1 Tax=uncultured Jatrophihabitans sp. TaxID=1610747 RepID=UPI0035CC9C94
MLLANPLNTDSLTSGSGALVVLAIIIFCESGLLIGFFLPGDTVLFAAGVSIATGAIASPEIGGSALTSFLIVLPAAAIVGNVVGYVIGYRVGPIVFDRPNSRMFRPEYVDRAHKFFERFGSWTILIGRFIPIVRTLLTVMAGVGRMRFPLFLLWTVVSGIIWTDGMVLFGHQLGQVKFVREHKGDIDYLIIVVVVIGLIPATIHYLQSRRRRTR